MAPVPRRNKHDFVSHPNLRLATLAYGWQYVCRTGSNIVVTACGVRFHVGDLKPVAGEPIALSPAWRTYGAYGPVSILAYWEQGFKQPLYLVTNMADLDAALALYKKRAHIESFFSAQKSRGFNIDKSHLKDPERISRLLIASCLAYLWLVYLGVCALQQEQWRKCLHRRKRCDLSLFRLGLRLLARCIKDDIPIPAGFLVPAIISTPSFSNVLAHAA